MIGASKNFAAVAPTVAYNAFAAPPNVIVTGPSGGLTSNSVNIYASGGDEPYAYSWLKLSGIGITISSETSGVVTFSSSGSDGAEKSSIYRCTVTDNSLNEIEVNVSVEFFFGTGSGATL